MNDVDIDHRGLAYAVDRAGAGLFILEYTGAQTATEHDELRTGGLISDEKTSAPQQRHSHCY